MADTTIPADIIAGLDDILEQVGVTGAIRVRVNTGADDVPVITETDNSVELIPVGYKLKDVDGTVIKQGDRQFLLLTDFEPSTSDYVVLDGNTYSIVSIPIITVSGITVLYKIQGRK